MSFCGSCGSALEEDDSYCGACGRAVTRPGTALLDRRAQESQLYADTAARLRHPKESAYFALAAVAGCFAWLFLIWIVLLIGWLLAIPVAIALWVTDKLYRAQLLGNSVRVTHEQFPEIYTMLQEFSQRLGLPSPPEVFIVNGNGAINAFALKILKGKYVLLLSDLVDVAIQKDSLAPLGSILGHELGHHALGHTSLLRTVVLWPSRFVPFLGPAYARACELSADRVGMWLVGSKEAAVRGLAALACGSRALSGSVNIEALKRQEEAIPPLFGFLSTVFSTHPRITMRIAELEAGQATVLTG